MHDSLYPPPPTGSTMAPPLQTSLWSGHTRKQGNPLVAVIHKQESRHMVPKSVLRAVLGRMDAVHPTCNSPNTSRRFALGASSTSAWLVKTRRAPSRHSRHAKVYGHTTTGMRKLSTPPPKPAILFNERFVAAGHEEGCYEKNHLRRSS